MYLPNIRLQSGETFYTWYEPPITEKLEEDYFRIVYNHFPLLDRIEQKYLDGIMLRILCDFRPEVRAAHQDEIGIMLNSDPGNIW